MEDDYQLGRGEAFTCYLKAGLRKDLQDMKRVSGESMSQLVSKALVALFRERARHLKPSSHQAERLIERYGLRKGL